MALSDIEGKALSYVPLLAYSVRMQALDGSGEAFFNYHRKMLCDEFGLETIDNLEKGVSGDLEAAKAFAAALVPTGVFTLLPYLDKKNATEYGYLDRVSGLNGRTISHVGTRASTLCLTAINLWEAIRRHMEYKKEMRIGGGFAA